MTRKEDFKHNGEGYNALLAPSSEVRFKPFIGDPVKTVLASTEKWKASDHRIVVDLPSGMPTNIDSEKIAMIIAKNPWFLRSAIPTILQMEQSYNERTNLANLKLAGYGITGLTPASVDLNAWRPGLKKPLLYSSTIGIALNNYLHLFTVPASGKSDNGRTGLANQVAMNKVDNWIDGEPFSPTTSAIATYVIAAGLKAIDENTQLSESDIEKAILNSENAIQYQGAIATIVLHGLSRWHNPLNWSKGMNTVQVKASSNNELNRGLRITNHALDQYTAGYVNAILTDLPNALSYQMQKALRAIEWDGSTKNDKRSLMSK